jgi:hypothetical protein
MTKNRTLERAEMLEAWGTAYPLIYTLALSRDAPLASRLSAASYAMICPEQQDTDLRVGHAA